MLRGFTASANSSSAAIFDASSRATARGVRFGRKPKLTAHQIAEARKRREAGEALSDIGRSFKSATAPFRGCEKGWLQ